MRLYSYFRSSSAWRVRIALALKNLSYEYVPVHLLRNDGEQRHSEFLRRNALGQVPVLEVDRAGASYFIAQSMAIIEYLDESAPTPPLLPRDPELRARARQLAEIVNSGIQPLQNIEALQLVDRHAPAFGRERWAQHFIFKGLTALEELSQETRGTFMVGNDVTLPDLYLIPQLFNARRFAVPLDSFPGLLGVERACEDLPAFRAAHPSVQPDAEKPSA